MSKTITRTVKIGATMRHTALPEGADEFLLRDKDLTGFALRIRKESARYIIAGIVAGTTTRRTITIGDATSLTAAEARERAMSYRNMLRSGEDPIKAKPLEISVPMFGEVATEFHARWAAGTLGRKAPRTASVVSRAKDIKRAVTAFGMRRIDQIDAAAIRRFRSNLMAESVSFAVKRRAFGALAQVMHFAQETGHVADNPATGFTLPSASAARERYLKSEELKAVWEACAALGRPGDALQFLIAMPVRLSIARFMEWTWIDVGSMTVTIPASAIGNKAGETFVLPLTDLAVEIVARQPTRDGIVFRGRQGGAVSLGSDVKDRLDALSGVHDWQIHDLRRTVVTLLADADQEIDVDAADRWLMHKRTGIQAVYQRASRLASMRKVAASWERTLRGLLGIEPNGETVTAFPVKAVLG